VADANTTVFTMNANDQTVVVDVYALGVLNEANPVAHDIPADEVEAHARLTALQNDLGYPKVGWKPMIGPMRPEPVPGRALRLLVTNVDNGREPRASTAIRSRGRLPPRRMRSARSARSRSSAAASSRATRP
jgi:hypothetical protein